MNGLRFFAAFAVIFTHVELMKKLLGHSSHWIIVDERVKIIPIQEVMTKRLSWLSPVIANAGPLGVVCFFVLSGFLITYLLLRERESTGF
ncbi:MAG: acyltransferase family protein, partial [Bacteroidota bacterium]